MQQKEKKMTEITGTPQNLKTAVQLEIGIFCRNQMSQKKCAQKVSRKPKKKDKMQST